MAQSVFGTLVRRYNRFMADVQLDDGTVVTAHCPNSGKMLGVLDAGNPVVLTHTPSEKRRLQYTWEAVQVAGVWIGINTHRTNKIVAEALAVKHIPEFASYDSIQAEVKYDENSRIDFLLKSERLPDIYLEVKNVHLKRDSVAVFPDCVTARGTKHLGALARMAQQGHKACVLYVIQRADVDCFQIAADIDPAYAAAGHAAHQMGVQFLVYNCEVKLTPEFDVMLGKPGIQG